FQAEDGIRDATVTGVQTCALPIYSDLKAPFSGFLLNRYIDLGSLVSLSSAAFTIADISSARATFGVPDYALSRVRLGQQLSIARSEERRVGKECRCMRSQTD